MLHSAFTNHFIRNSCISVHLPRLMEQINTGNLHCQYLNWQNCSDRLLFVADMSGTSDAFLLPHSMCCVFSEAFHFTVVNKYALKLYFIIKCTMEWSWSWETTRWPHTFKKEKSHWVHGQLIVFTGLKQDQSFTSLLSVNLSHFSSSDVLY